MMQTLPYTFMQKIETSNGGFPRDLLALNPTKSLKNLSKIPAVSLFYFIDP